MRPRYAWLLIAAAGIGLVVGVRLSAGGGNDRGSGPTTSTTAGSAAIAEFARLHGDRVRALETWTPAVAAPLTAFLPVSGKVMREEQRIMERAAATANTCDTADEDPCRLLGILHELADRERSRLGMLVRAKRLDRRAEAYAAFTGLRSDNCDYAGKVVDLLDRPSSPDLLSRRLPMLRDHAYAIALTACDATRNSDQMLLGAARAARVRPTAWPPSVLRMHLPADEWRIYATAVDRSAVMVEKVLAELQSDLEAVRDGFMPPEAFADVAGPDPAAAQSWLYLDDGRYAVSAHPGQLIRRAGPRGIRFPPPVASLPPIGQVG